MNRMCTILTSDHITVVSLVKDVILVAVCPVTLGNLEGRHSRLLPATSDGTIYRIVSNITILRSYRGISLSR